SSSPLVLTVVPLELSGPFPGGDRSVRGLIFIADPDRADDPDIGTLRQAFDLTYREAKVALAVAQGHGLQAAADASGVAMTTARSQLQQVFGKTGTSRQAELTALLHRTLGTVRRD
ncbi:MAG TPA: helix-turn-helix transcriptional regulator, partial [Stellaceae bacterium]|nr:helix-turn-helix transcriptional regulator [Stellaceae bacterium]